MAGSAGMIEVDVGDDHRRDVVDADGVERIGQVVHRHGRPALDEDPFRGVEQVARQPLGRVVHPGVDHVEVVAEVGHLHVDHGRRA